MANAIPRRWTAAELTKTLLFKTLTYRAAGFIAKPLLLFQVAQRALTKADKDASLRGMAQGAVESVQRLVRLIRAYAKGEYRGVSRKNAVLVVATILYFVSPLDIVPDAIPIIGLLDDITLMGWVIKTLGDELTKFEAHERDQRDALVGMSYADLYQEAKQRDIAGRSGMSKQELVAALEGRSMS